MFATSSTTGSATDVSIAEFKDWANAQIIFLDDGRPISKALRSATGSPYSHVGMVRMTGGGPVVLDTSPTLWEHFVEEFLSKSIDGRYAVYQLNSLSDPDGFTPPRVANNFLSTPDDPHLRAGETELSGAELVRLGFVELGVELGETTTFNRLAAYSDEVRTWFRSVWQEHPDCKKLFADEEACWDIVRHQQILTPGSLADDPRLTCIWSNFEVDQARCTGPK